MQAERIRWWHHIRHWFYLAAGFGPFAIACITTIVFAPLLNFLLRRRPTLRTKIGRGAVHRLFRFVMWQLRFMGYLDARFIEPEGEKGEQRLLVCNHISFFDVIAIIAHFPDCSSFMKASLAKNVLMGPMMKFCDYIPIDAADPEHRARAFMRALAHLRAGGRIVVFPEGTRSKDGALLPFHAGVFRLSLESGVPVTPIVLTSDRPIFNKVGPFQPSVRGITYRGHILPPLPNPQPDGSLAVAAKEFRDKVFRAFTHWLSTDLASDWNRLSDGLRLRRFENQRSGDAQLSARPRGERSGPTRSTPHAGKESPALPRAF